MELNALFRFGVIRSAFRVIVFMSTCTSAATYRNMIWHPLTSLCVLTFSGVSVTQVFNLTCEMNDYFAAFAFAGSTMPASAYPDSESCGVPFEKMKPMLGLCGGTDGCSTSIEPWFGRYSGLYECTGAPVVDKVSDTTTCYGHRQVLPPRNTHI